MSLGLYVGLFSAKELAQMARPTSLSGCKLAKLGFITMITASRDTYTFDMRSANLARHHSLDKLHQSHSLLSMVTDETNGRTYIHRVRSSLIEVTRWKSERKSKIAIEWEREREDNVRMSTYILIDQCRHNKSSSQYRFNWWPIDVWSISSPFIRSMPNFLMFPFYRMLLHAYLLLS